eukprot:Protomagalhaensia_wolfi_Nauph_80__4389@NODE_4494_length_559_cov_4_200000_g3596_i0_p1_GENE_NODE_4494_length_559_cov_4_200000_g3596_i0NODE_4494_length_559_cov_4_200000_g3596_i0_p1_ORF_typecomplete_len123_score37_89TPR_16/PF13432_6/3_4e06TPR_16/PF13432_6/7_3e10TPR_16/PF13432_6/4_5e08TPR_16/PF13432_6/0_03TPR_19/PF14559_6/4_8e08TPR_19/PF14559_6/6_8e08TPR_19/PF14559_6/4_2e07ANAPC3/PF12895_7/3_7e08ANAPC3/PF12895_7/9_5e11ANAPC3/PF12895_7/0_0012TPR_15/PF13429_6/2_6e20TPR_9/PF13371_6/0_00014TPR_9/PF13371_
MVVGQCYSQLGKPTKAKRYCDRAIKKRPNDPWAYVARATTLVNSGDFKSALCDAERALKLDPNNGHAWDTHGRALFGLNEFQKAADSHIKALRLTPDNRDFQAALDHALKSLGE